MNTTIEKQIEKILNELLVYEPEKIILYGSTARGEISEESDIDLLIIKKTDKDMFERIGEVLSLWKTWSIPIEPIVLTPEEFDKVVQEERLYAEMILKEGKVIYEK